jgi:hypothetical protein
MRNDLHTNPMVYKIVVAITCCMMLIIVQKSKAEKGNLVQQKVHPYQMVR